MTTYATDTSKFTPAQLAVYNAQMRGEPVTQAMLDAASSGVVASSPLNTQSGVSGLLSAPTSTTTSAPTATTAATSFNRAMTADQIKTLAGNMMDKQGKTAGQIAQELERSGINQDLAISALGSWQSTNPRIRGGGNMTGADYINQVYGDLFQPDIQSTQYDQFDKQVTDGQYKDAYATARAAGISDPNQIAQYVNQRWGKNLTGDQIMQYVRGQQGTTPAGGTTPSTTTPTPTTTPTAAPSQNLGIGGSQGLTYGGVNASDAYGQLLSGKPDMNVLQPMFDAGARRMTDNFQNSYLPQVRSGSMAAGQYGGSRQGIAEGLGYQGLSNSLADFGANLYGSAYNNAKGLQANAAAQIGGFNQNQYGLETNRTGTLGGLQIGQYNAETSRMNANTSADSNYWNNLINFGNMQANAANGAVNLGLGANNYPWQQLGQYSNIANSSGGLGNSQSQTNYTNPYLNAIGGAQVFNQMFKG